MKALTLIITLLVTLSLPYAIAASSKYHEEAEAREFNPENCERMRKNWEKEAVAWCTGSGGVDWNNSTKTCVEDGQSPSFTKVKGTINCND